MHQMGRCIDMDAKALRFQHCAREGAGRTLAVCPCHVDHRRQSLFWMAKPGEQPLDTVEHEIDALRMKLQQALENGVAACSNTHGTPVAAGAVLLIDAGKEELSFGCLVSCRTRRESVSRIWWRCTTMSTIPCSSRYSAR